MEELYVTLKKKKSLSTNGVISEFYKMFRDDSLAVWGIKNRVREFSS